MNLAKIYIFVVHRVKFEFRIIFNHGKANHMGIRNDYQAVSPFFAIRVIRIFSHMKNWSWCQKTHKNEKTALIH